MTTNDQYPSSRQFGTIEEAKAYVKEQKMWQYKYTPNLSTGSKLSYLCKFDNKCSGRIQLWMPNDSLDVTTNTIMPQDLYKIFHQIKKNIINIWNNDKRKPNRNLVFAKSCKTSKHISICSKEKRWRSYIIFGTTRSIQMKDPYGM